MNQEERCELLELLWSNCAPDSEQNADIVTRLLIAHGFTPERFGTTWNDLLPHLGLTVRSAAGLRLVHIPAREVLSESVEAEEKTSKSVEQENTASSAAKSCEETSERVEPEKNESDFVESAPMVSSDRPQKSAKKPTLRAFDAVAQAEVRALLLGEYAPGSHIPMAQVFHFLDDRGCAANTFELDGKPLKGRRILEILNIQITPDQANPVNLMVRIPGDTQQISSESVETGDHLSNAVESAPTGQQDWSNFAEKPNQPPKDCRSEIFFPIANRERLAEQLGVPTLTPHYWDELNAAYNAAAAAGQVTWNEHRHCFNAVLSLTNTSGYPLLLGISRSDQKNGLPFYLSFVGTAPKSARLSPLQEFAWLGNYHSFLQQLADLAEPEMWSFQSRDDLSILNNYITYTFARLKQQGKVYIDPGERFAAFNTGLMSRIYGEDLLAYFVPNNVPGRQKWMFSAFCSTLDEARGDRTQQTAAITLAPVRSRLTLASYFTDVCFETRFDPNCELDYQFFHIIGDNIGRFPLDFLRKHCNDFPRSKALLAQIEAEQDSAKKRQLFKQLGAAVTDLEDADMSALFYDLRIQFEAAVNRTLELARRDYKVGVPCFFPTTGKLSMLLPISFSARRNAKPCLALVAERLDNGMYVGRTVLTMDMAYKDSRLLCRPSGEWLRPADIQADAADSEE